MSWLLDTNIVSELHKRTPNLNVLNRVREETGLFLSTPVWHELRFGLERAREGVRRQKLERFLELISARLVVLPYDAEAAELHAQERARLERAGRPPPFIDGALAAIAVTRGLTLATRNVRDFSLFEGLRVENWFEVG